MRILKCAAAVAASVIVGGLAMGCGTAGQVSADVSKGRKEVITSLKGAPPVGPYSQAIRAGDFIFVAGVKGLDPETGKVVSGGIQAETRQALLNIQAVLEAGGASLDDAVSSVVHLADINEFQQMNAVYGEFFKQDPPGRTTLQAAALPAGANIEITITTYSPR